MPDRWELIRERLRQAEGALFTQCVWAVGDNRQIGESYALGCGEDAVFDLASVSKLLTTTFLLQMIGEGTLSLTEPLAEHFSQAGTITRQRLGKITPQMLLTHSSGLPAWYPFYTGRGSFWDILENILEENQSGVGTLYSDINFMLLGELARQVSGRSLSQLLESLNRELGTGFSYRPSQRENCIPTEYGNRIEEGMCTQRGLSFDGWRDNTCQIVGEANDGNAHYFWQGEAGHAGVFGRGKDLLGLAGLYLREGRTAQRQLIPSQLVSKSLQDQGNGRGLGWDCSDIFPEGAGHTGFTGTAVWACPSRGLSSVLLTSRLPIEGPPNLQPLRKEIFTLCHQ